MKAKFNVTGAARKELVGAIAQLLEEKAVYQGMPSASYNVGGFTITKDGSLEWGDADASKAELLLERLIELGYEAEFETGEVEPTAGTTDENTGLSISMPRDKFPEEAINNLHNLVKGKGTLMKAAFLVDDLSIELDEEKISFPWFRIVSPEHTKAYTVFIQAISEMAINQKRISAKEKEVINAKYEFRCFLLRLGFIGDEYKQVRKILLSNLTGSSAFKNEVKKDGE